MSVIEKTADQIVSNSSAEENKQRTETNEKGENSVFTRFLAFLSSVRFGIFLLIIVASLCFLGMVIMQQNVDGFERYYAELTPAQRLVYGSLGLFDVYHSWYFNAFLLILSLNIILSSIDRFPKTWSFIANRKLNASTKWLEGQSAHAGIETESENAESLAAKIAQNAKNLGWRKTIISSKGGKTFVFAESGVWNRFAYLAVHVGLLTIFAGGFMTGQLGNTGQMTLQPGQSSNQIFEIVSNLDKLDQVTKRLPFEIVCTDIQQKLIKNDGSINAMNTIDWITKIQIKDETGVTEGTVQMNRPFDYRGYRFFQSSFVATGRARNITLKLKAADGSTQNVTIARNGAAALPDGTNIKLVDFRGNFSMGKEDPNEDTSDYQNPAAVLEVTPQSGTTQTAYAFTEKMSGIPIASKQIAGFTFQLADFEKVGDQHILSIQRDPGATVVYVGFLILCVMLVAVFFFSHQRVWAAIEEVSPEKFKVAFGGNTNRNQTAFNEKFREFVKKLSAV